jgi:hypothetical protein
VRTERETPPGLLIKLFEGFFICPSDNVIRIKG